MATEKEKAPEIMLPEGRITFQALFVKDQYNEQAAPAYKIELAFEKGALDRINDQMLDFANDTWGAGAEDSVVLPIKDGDVMAKKKEDNGKEGEAYKGMDVLRANTIYNKHGENGPGGISVYSPDGETEIGIANQSEMYSGCYGIAAVTFKEYTQEDPRTKETYNGITLYLVAVQKTRDGERLIAQQDRSKLFKPVGRTAPNPETGEEGSKRSRRKG